MLFAVSGVHTGTGQNFGGGQQGAPLIFGGDTVKVKCSVVPRNTEKRKILQSPGRVSVSMRASACNLCCAQANEIRSLKLFAPLLSRPSPDSLRLLSPNIMNSVQISTPTPTAIHSDNCRACSAYCRTIFLHTSLHSWHQGGRLHRHPELKWKTAMAPITQPSKQQILQWHNFLEVTRATPKAPTSRTAKEQTWQDVAEMLNRNHASPSNLIRQL